MRAFSHWKTVGENRSDQCSPANERTANKSVFYHQKRVQIVAALGCCLSLYCSSNGLLMEDVYTHTQWLHYLSSATLHVYILVCTNCLCILIFWTQVFLLGVLPVINQNRTEAMENDKNWTISHDSDINYWMRTQYYSEIYSVFYHQRHAVLWFIFIYSGV